MASHDKRNTRSTWDAVEVGGGEDGVDVADDSRPGERGKSGLVPLDLVKLANKFTRLLLF